MDVLDVSLSDLLCDLNLNENQTNNPNEDSFDYEIESNMAQCLLMCPEDEFKFRKKNNLLHRLELFEDGNNTESIPIKEYKRPSAGRKLEEPKYIRPTNVLKETIDYLLSNKTKLLAKRKTSNPLDSFGMYYDFVFNRLRAIRQDLTIQRAFHLNCFYILERCIEFYIRSHYTWCHLINKNQESSTITNIKKYFDPHINKTHLRECLYLLIAYYDLFNRRFWSRQRATFESLFLLFNLNPNSEQLTFQRYQQLKFQTKDECNDFFHTKTMKFIRRLIENYCLGNHIKTLKMIKKRFSTESLLCSLFFIHNLPYHHLMLLKSISIGHTTPAPSTKLPLSILVKWFCPNANNDVDDGKQKSNRNLINYMEQLFQKQNIPLEYPNPMNDDYDKSSEINAVINKQQLLKVFWNELGEHVKPMDWMIVANLI